MACISLNRRRSSFTAIVPPLRFCTTNVARHRSLDSANLTIAITLCPSPPYGRRATLLQNKKKFLEGNVRPSHLRRRIAGWRYKRLTPQLIPSFWVKLDIPKRLRGNVKRFVTVPQWVALAV